MALVLTTIPSKLSLTKLGEYKILSLVLTTIPSKLSLTKLGECKIRTLVLTTIPSKLSLTKVGECKILTSVLTNPGECKILTSDNQLFEFESDKPRLLTTISSESDKLSLSLKVSLTNLGKEKLSNLTWIK